MRAPTWCGHWQRLLSTGAEWVDSETLRVAVRAARPDHVIAGRQLDRLCLPQLCRGAKTACLVEDEQTIRCSVRPELRGQQALALWSEHLHIGGQVGRKRPEASFFSDSNCYGSSSTDHFEDRLITYRRKEDAQHTVPV